VLTSLYYSTLTKVDRSNIFQPSALSAPFPTYHYLYIGPLTLFLLNFASTEAYHQTTSIDMNGALVVLNGYPGVGKTAIANELL
jgi:MoxR-like ATPase